MLAGGEGEKRSCPGVRSRMEGGRPASSRHPSPASYSGKRGGGGSTLGWESLAGGTTPGRLQLAADRLRLEDWTRLLPALSRDVSLHSLQIVSKHTHSGILSAAGSEVEVRAEGVRRPPLYTKYVMSRLVESLVSCLSLSHTLSSLLLVRIPIKGDLFSLFCQGVSKSRSVQHVALQHCPVLDEGCRQLCLALHSRANITTLDLTDCGLTHHSASHLANLIKVQSNSRYGESWKHSLRYSKVEEDELPGLRRLTLNQNPLGDEGLSPLIDVLRDDIWLKALDVQQCGVGEGGARAALALLEQNITLEVLDLRGNLPQHQLSLIHSILEKLAANRKQSNAKSCYKWLEEVKGLRSCMSQLTLATGGPSSASKSHHAPSSTRSCATMRSTASEAPWRSNKLKSLFTINQSCRSAANVKRCKSFEPNSKFLVMKTVAKEKPVREPPHTPVLKHIVEKQVVRAKEAEVKSIRIEGKKKPPMPGLSEHQLRALSEFKKLTSELISGARSDDGEVRRRAEECPGVGVLRPLTASVAQQGEGMGEGARLMFSKMLESRRKTHVPNLLPPSQPNLHLMCGDGAVQETRGAEGSLSKPRAHQLFVKLLEDRKNSLIGREKEAERGVRGSESSGNVCLGARPRLAARVVSALSLTPSTHL